MTHQDLEFRLSIIRYLVRDLMHDLRTGSRSPVVETVHQVALDELRTVRSSLDRIDEYIREIQDEVQP